MSDELLRNQRPPASLPTLADLAQRLGLQLAGGENATTVSGVCALAPGQAGHLAYAEGQANLKALETTRAGAVIVPEAMAAHAPVPALVAEQPKLIFARIARLFEYQPDAQAIHATAVIHPDARIGEAVCIGPHAVVGADSVIGRGSRIGANTVIGDHVVLGEGCTVGANTTLHHHVRAGHRVRIGANTAIGERGFGLAHNGEGWEPIPQLGTVVLGDDVEIGSSTTIDRGALGDTVIADNACIDNQIQIGHNCQIGQHTIIAGSAGIAGSVTIGNNCLIGGGVGVGDHVTIVDNVMITAASQVPRDINEPGVWSSTFRAMPAGQWRKILARFRKPERLERRLKRIEGAIQRRDLQD